MVNSGGRTMRPPFFALNWRLGPLSEMTVPALMADSGRPVVDLQYSHEHRQHA
jgi:hypothetical protein